MCTAFFSCSQRSENQSEQISSDSLGVAPMSEEMDKSSAAYSPEDGAVNEKAKKDITSPSINEQTKKETGFSLSQDLERQSDTIYLKNVRLSKKFIKTADLKFKAKKVENTTHVIEKLAIDLGGYVQQSEINSTVNLQRNIELSSDTMLSVSEYYVYNNLIIRVPCIYFDSVLNFIAKQHIYLDYRKVQTLDVSTTFLRNKLKAEKNSEYEKRIQKLSDQNVRRLNDNVNAETQAAELADKAIDKKIENYELQDKIDFSTVSMNIYQANSVFEERVKNTQLKQYKPGFWKRAWDAILGGWNIILEILIALIYLWPIYLLLILIYIGIKYFRNRFMK